jgi:hypothetical protein
MRECLKVLGTEIRHAPSEPAKLAARNGKNGKRAREKVAA